MTNENRNGSSAEGPLESWKEIAAYLQRDVSTVIRWEKHEHLPVHRHHHLSRSSVYAYPSELEAWRANRTPSTEAPRPLWRRPLPSAAFALTVLLALVSASSGPEVGAVQAADGAGITLRQVWTGPGADTPGPPSPDGRYLSDIDWATGDLAILDLASGEKRRLTAQKVFNPDAYAFSPVWSPDGKELAYLCGDRELRIVSLDGAPPRVVSEHPSVPIAWLPDGSGLLVVSHRDEDLRRFYRIEKVSLPDGKVSLLKELDLPMRGGGPAVSLSPDGRHIAFDQPEESNSARLDIFMMAADGGQQRALIRHAADDRLLGWAPDGKGILFSSDRTGDRDAWILPVADGNPAGPPKLVKKDIGEVVPLGFAQGGSYFYRRKVSGQDIYVQAVDPASGSLLGSPERATESWPGLTTLPQWSPDGLSLAYVALRSYPPASQSTVVIHSLSDGLERELLAAPSRASFLRWSPDGRSLLVGENRGARLVDVTTGKATPVINLPDPEINLNAAWTPDGRTIFYSSRDYPEQSGRIVRLDVRSGATETIWSYPRFINPIDLAVSPDGKRLAFTRAWTEVDGKPQPHFIMAIPAAGGEAREIARVELPNILIPRTLFWTPDGRYLVFEKVLDTTAAKPGLWRVAATGGEPEQVMELAGLIEYLSLQPGGRRLAFAAGRSREEVWVMENFLPVAEAAAR